MRARVALVVLLLIPVAAASSHDPLVHAGRNDLETEVEAGAGEQVAHMVFPFSLKRAHQVYTKVVPADLPAQPDLNPHLAPNATGWNVEVHLDGRLVASMPGHGLVELGFLDAGTTYTLTLAITVPANATATPRTHAFLFSLAARSEPDGNGSGGVLDPSLSIPGTIEVVEPSADVAASGAAGRWIDAPIVQVLAAAAVLVVLVFGVLRGRRAWQGASRRRRERWARGLSEEDLERIRGGGP